MASKQKQCNLKAEDIDMYISEESDDYTDLDEPSSRGLKFKRRLFYDFELPEELNKELLEDNPEREKDYEEESDEELSYEEENDEKESYEEDSDEDDNSKWKSKNFKSKIIEFIGNPGLKVSSPSNNKFEWFELFLTPELVEHVVIETNRYAEQFFLAKTVSFSEGSKTEGPFSAWRRKEWIPVTKNEMYRFLGLHLQE